MRRLIPYGLFLLLCVPGKISGQRVVYSESIANRNTTQIQVIGKSENFYWVNKLQHGRTFNGQNRNADIPRQSFVLFNPRLEAVNEIDAVSIPGSIKQWLLADKNGMDQLTLVRSGVQTQLYCSRFKVDQSSSAVTRLLDSIPLSVSASRFLLVRSERQSKILLLAFEMEETENMTLHALLFDADWNLVYHKTFPHAPFSQPFIQDDEIGFPAESFDNFPIKLTDNGEFLMAYNSCISRNFSLFHASGDGNDFHFREIPVSNLYKTEDIAMSLDNENESLKIGFLSSFKNTTLKNVQVSNYSIKKGTVDFDSAYRFNTTARDTRNKNLYHERFVSIPGAGFMMLKEYGLPHEYNNRSIPPMDPWETAYMLTNYSESNPQQKNGYSLNPGLSPIPVIYNPGDLNLFYFPGKSGDSVWSGILQMEQKSESNNPELSYLLIPANQKLYIIYNSLDGFTDPLATSTALNLHGQTTDDPLVFWKVNRQLNFQQAHRFTSGEIAVPYLQNNQRGFALIRL